MPVTFFPCHDRHDTDRGHRGFPGKRQARGRVLLLLGILLFLNYGVARISDFLAFQMWPSDVDMAVLIVFGSAVLYVVLMALPFMPGIEIGLMLMAMLGVGGVSFSSTFAPCWRFR